VTTLEQRVARMRQRLVVRAWEYRQRDLAKGVWTKVRRLLVDAESAWIIDAADVEIVRAAGIRPESDGLRLQPPKEIRFVSSEVLSTLPSRQTIDLGMNAAFLEATHVVLVAHPGFRGRPVPASGR